MIEYMKNMTQNKRDLKSYLGASLLKNGDCKIPAMKTILFLPES